MKKILKRSIGGWYFFIKFIGSPGFRSWIESKIKGA